MKGEQWTVGYGRGVSGARAAAAVWWDGTTIKELPVRSGRDVVCWLASADQSEDLTPDARLIAAAPEMYAALEAIVSGVDKPVVDCREVAAWYDNARAVLAKARGEQ